MASVNEVSSHRVECKEGCTYLLQLRHKIERNEEAFRFNPTDDIYVVASLLKVRRQSIYPTALVDIHLDVSTRTS